MHYRKIVPLLVCLFLFPNFSQAGFKRSCNSFLKVAALLTLTSSCQICESPPPPSLTRDQVLERKAETIVWNEGRNPNAERYLDFQMLGSLSPLFNDRVEGRGESSWGNVIRERPSVQNNLQEWEYQFIGTDEFGEIRGYHYRGLKSALSELVHSLSLPHDQEENFPENFYVSTSEIIQLHQIYSALLDLSFLSKDLQKLVVKVQVDSSEGITVRKVSDDSGSELVELTIRFVEKNFDRHVTRATRWGHDLETPDPTDFFQQSAVLRFRVGENHAQIFRAWAQFGERPAEFDENGEPYIYLDSLGFTEAQIQNLGTEIELGLIQAQKIVEELRDLLSSL